MDSTGHYQSLSSKDVDEILSKAKCTKSKIKRIEVDGADITFYFEDEDGNVCEEPFSYTEFEVGSYTRDTLLRIEDRILMFNAITKETHD